MKPYINDDVLIIEKDDKYAKIFIYFSEKIKKLHEKIDVLKLKSDELSSFCDLMDDFKEKETFDFINAVKFCEDGKKCRRKGWGLDGADFLDISDIKSTDWEIIE